MTDNSLSRSYYGKCFRANHLDESVQFIFDQLLSLIVAALIILSPCSGWSQMEDISSSLQWGSIQKAPKNSRLVKIIYAHPQGALTLRYQKENLFSSEQFWLEKYDNRFNLVAKHELNLAEDHKLNLEDLFYWHGILYLISSRTEADEINRVWIRPISQTGQLIGTERLIAEIPKEEKFRKRQFDLKFSKDSSFLLLYNQLPPEKDGPERFTLRVFDQTFNLRWSKDVSLPFRDENYSIRDYQIDGLANVFILGNRKRTQNGRKMPSVYSLYAYTNMGKTETVYNFELDNTVFHQLRFSIGKEGRLVVGGIYSLNNYIHNFGLFHVDINVENQEIGTVRQSPFLEKTVENTRGAQEDIPSNYRLRDLVLRSDGGVVIVAEQYARFNRNSMTREGSQSETFFVYNDILVANMTADGGFSWFKRIPKLQITTNDGGAFSSFAQATVQDRFYFIYNDNPDNFRPNNRRQENMDQFSSVVSLTEIKRDGTLNTIPLFVNKDADIITRPKLCQQIGAKSILVYGEDRRDYRFGLLRFE